MNRDSAMNLLEYQHLSKATDANIIDTINATRGSYVKLNINNERINGMYDRFIVECECKPYFKKSMNIAGIVSTTGPAKGWELRITNAYGTKKFEWVFTTCWEDARSNKTMWQHNELVVDINDIDKIDLNDWIYLKGEYDFVNGLQSFTVNDATLSKAIKGRPQVETRRGVELGRAYASNDRAYYGLIRNVKID
eukprot:376452_1